MNQCGSLTKIERIQLSKEWLDCAQNDLEASRVLFEAKLYASSTYHLQQAVEKATKSFGIISEVINPEEARSEVGHRSALLFVKLLRKYEALANSLKAQYPQISGDADTLEQTLTDKMEEIGRWDKENITKILSVAKQCEEIVNTINATVDNENSANPIAISSGLAISLYLTANITYPHFQWPRYPDGKLKARDYTAGLGIVDCHQQVYDASHKAIGSVSSFIKMVEDSQKVLL